MAAPKRVQFGMVGVGVVALGLFGWVLFHKKPAAKPPPPGATAIATGKVEVRDVPVSINALGQAIGWQAVLVRAQANGKLLRVNVTEGGEVKQGDLIAEIDPAPYRAILMQAEGALRRDQAQLDLAKLNLTRYRQLAGQDSIAGQEVDTQAALVKQYEGAVQVDQGSVAAATVNLNFTRILAPLSGRVGVRLVDAGNLVSATDTTGIVTINQVSPIGVLFTLPQGEFLRLSQASDSFRRPLVTNAYSQETGELLGSGELTVVDNRVDPTTATVQLKARFPNGDRKMWPGQLLNVKLTLSTMRQATVLPSVAVNQGPQGAFAYVVGADNKAEMRPLVVDLTQDDLTAVKSGVKPGETVVVDGQLSLKPGAKVAVRGAPPAKGRPAA